MFKEVKNIVIVGGGSSAWLAAAYFSNQSNFTVTVIDKEQADPVGVGEATLLGFPDFMSSCGFDEKEWFPAVDGTYKSGILFPGWGRDHIDVWHPFAIDPNNLNILGEWLATQDSPLSNYLALYDISKNNLVDSSAQNFYAVHIDCLKLISFIQEKIVDKIRFVNSGVILVERHNAEVTHVVCESGEKISGDMFIDCTGFKQILIGSSDNISLEDKLPCNSAVAGHVSYKNFQKECRPYVTCTPLAEGWMWNIPVRTRIGSGLVFNRNLTDIETAKQKFAEYWNNRIDIENVKVLKWDPYVNNQPWKMNVAAIGLSSGFLEPLESTGLAIICKGIQVLHDRIQQNYFDNSDVRLYNEIMLATYSEAVDFVAMHYSRKVKDSDFWNHAYNLPNPDVQNYLEKKYKENHTLNYTGKGHIFSLANWHCWLLQLSELPLKNKSHSKVLDTYKDLLDNKTTEAIDHTWLLKQGH
jgi:tryptophan halogenase